jgi:LysR family transcriptional regulator, regulator for genes of the gallate degradation pathway
MAMQAGDLNLRHLQAVAAIVRHGSLSRAADRIALTQPALTQAVRSLERALGQPLFDRQPGGMQPTEAGRILALRIETALAHIGSPRVTAAQMRAFLALCEAGSYPRASVATGLAQPSLHRAVGDLSVALRRKLVVRQGKGLVITEAGRGMARRLRLARAELEAGLAELSALSGLDSGRVAVGAMPLARARALPAAVSAFLRQHRDAQVLISEGSYAELIEPLRDGRLDLLVGALRDPCDSDLTQTALFVDRPAIIARAEHPLAGTAPGLAAMARYPWIVANPDTPLHAAWARLFADSGIAQPAAPIICGSVLTARQILRESDLLVLLSPEQLAVELEAGLLRILAEVPPTISRTIGIITRADWRPTTLQSGFTDALRRASLRTAL